MKKYSAYYSSPLGLILVESNDDSITKVSFQEKKEKQNQSSSVIEKCIQELEEYFIGKRKSFDVPLNFKGTDFQNKVWNQLTKIPHGKTISYFQLAKKLGDVKSIRATGTANGKNPIAVIVPCHRVIGSDGSMVGYAGGLWRKKWLLEFESGKKQGEMF